MCDASQEQQQLEDVRRIYDELRHTQTETPNDDNDLTRSEENSVIYLIYPILKIAIAGRISDPSPKNIRFASRNKNTKSFDIEVWDRDKLLIVVEAKNLTSNLKTSKKGSLKEVSNKDKKSYFKKGKLSGDKKCLVENIETIDCNDTAFYTKCEKAIDKKEQEIKDSRVAPLNNLETILNDELTDSEKKAAIRTELRAIKKRTGALGLGKKAMMETINNDKSSWCEECKVIIDNTKTEVCKENLPNFLNQFREKLDENLSSKGQDDYYAQVRWYYTRVNFHNNELKPIAILTNGCDWKILDDSFFTENLKDDINENRHIKSQCSLVLKNGEELIDDKDEPLPKNDSSFPNTKFENDFIPELKRAVNNLQ